MVHDKLITNSAKTEGLKLHREDLDNHVIPEVLSCSTREDTRA